MKREIKYRAGTILHYCIKYQVYDMTNDYWFVQSLECEMSGPTLTDYLHTVRKRYGENASITFLNIIK